MAFEFDEFTPSSLAELIAWTLTVAVSNGQKRRSVVDLCLRVLSDDARVLDAALCDVEVTGCRNLEEPFLASTFLYSRGLHIALGHRVVHGLWRRDERDAASALHFLLSNAFATDIHPAAEIGNGLWLDHGIGFVVGATAVIGEKASIWHRVTLGSTLKQLAGVRHPQIGNGVTIGAGATILGNVQIGDGSVIAAGSVVVSDVPDGTTVAGVPAKPRQRNATSFSGL